jgi:hypothetical protein
MNKNKAGLVFGSFLAFMHLVWSVLVATGLAQAYLNFIFNLHMIANPFQVQAFSLGRAAGLIIVTFLIGYAFGCVFAWFWNKMKQ